MRGAGLRGIVTKDEARQEAIRRWRALPEDERQTYRHAQVLAAGLAEELDFRTMGNARKVITAWLVHEMNGGRIPRVRVPDGLAEPEEEAEPAAHGEDTSRAAAE
jgi:hypothetical protein